MQLSVDYLGHCIDTTGIHMLECKKEAIIQALAPKNLQQLGYTLDSFITITEKLFPTETPCHTLCIVYYSINRSGAGMTNVPGAFAATKQALVSSDILIHYDPNLPFTLAGDASAY